MHQSLCTLNLNALTATRAVKMNICVCSQKERKKIHVKKKRCLAINIYKCLLWTQVFEECSLVHRVCLNKDLALCEAQGRSCSTTPLTSHSVWVQHVTHSLCS